MTEEPIDRQEAQRRLLQEYIFNLEDVRDRAEELAADHEKLNQYREHLETLVRERTEELVNANRQLLQAQKLEAVGKLAGGIAHDFNNILGAIMGYANIIQMKMPHYDPLRIYVDQIVASSQRAAKLTQSLLAFSRKQMINPKPLELNETIVQMGKLLARLITEDIEIKHALCPEPLVVLADSGQIDQILMNLVTNARDALPDGGTITIQTGRATINEEFKKSRGYGAPGEYAAMSLTDDGIGIEAAMHDKIFEPFFTTKEVGKGTGLGLSIVYGIVKQHQGYIEMASAAGQGTTFTVYFPLVAREVEPVAEESANAPSGRESILIAEDNEELRYLLKTILNEHGYVTVEAEDGAEAIHRFREERPDLVILDVVMPKKNGREVYEAIRAIDPSAKVLFISGYTADVISQKGLTEDGIELIGKPFSPSFLLRKVRTLFDGKTGPGCVVAPGGLPDSPEARG